MQLLRRKRSASLRAAREPSPSPDIAPAAHQPPVLPAAYAHTWHAGAGGPGEGGNERGEGDVGALPLYARFATVGAGGALGGGIGIGEGDGWGDEVQRAVEQAGAAAEGARAEGARVDGDAEREARRARRRERDRERDADAEADAPARRQTRRRGPPLSPSAYAASPRLSKRASASTHAAPGEGRGRRGAPERDGGAAAPLAREGSTQAAARARDDVEGVEREGGVPALAEAHAQQPEPGHAGPAREQGAYESEGSAEGPARAGQPRRKYSLLAALGLGRRGADGSSSDEVRDEVSASAVTSWLTSPDWAGPGGGEAPAGTGRTDAARRRRTLPLRRGAFLGHRDGVLAVLPAGGYKRRQQRGPRARLAALCPRPRYPADLALFTVAMHMLTRAHTQAQPPRGREKGKRRDAPAAVSAAVPPRPRHRAIAARHLAIQPPGHSVRGSHDATRCAYVVLVSSLARGRPIALASGCSSLMPNVCLTGARVGDCALVTRCHAPRACSVRVARTCPVRACHRVRMWRLVAGWAGPGVRWSTCGAPVARQMAAKRLARRAWGAMCFDCRGWHASQLSLARSSELTRTVQVPTSCGRRVARCAEAVTDGRARSGGVPCAALARCRRPRCARRRPGACMLAARVGVTVGLGADLDWGSSAADTCARGQTTAVRACPRSSCIPSGDRASRLISVRPLHARIMSAASVLPLPAPPLGSARLPLRLCIPPSAFAPAAASAPRTPAMRRASSHSLRAHPQMHLQQMQQMQMQQMQQMQSLQMMQMQMMHGAYAGQNFDGSVYQGQGGSVYQGQGGSGYPSQSPSHIQSQNQGAYQAPPGAYLPQTQAQSPSQSRRPSANHHQSAGPAQPQSRSQSQSQSQSRRPSAGAGQPQWQPQSQSQYQSQPHPQYQPQPQPHPQYQPQPQPQSQSQPQPQYQPQPQSQSRSQPPSRSQSRRPSASGAHPAPAPPAQGLPGGDARRVERMTSRESAKVIQTSREAVGVASPRMVARKAPPALGHDAQQLLSPPLSPPEDIRPRRASRQPQQMQPVQVQPVQREPSARAQQTQSEQQPTQSDPWQKQSDPQQRQSEQQQKQTVPEPGRPRIFAAMPPAGDPGESGSDDEDEDVPLAQSPLVRGRPRIFEAMDNAAAGLGPSPGIGLGLDIDGRGPVAGAAESTEDKDERGMDDDDDDDDERAYENTCGYPTPRSASPATREGGAGAVEAQVVRLSTDPGAERVRSETDELERVHVPAADAVEVSAAARTGMRLPRRKSRSVPPAGTHARARSASREGGWRAWFGRGASKERQGAADGAGSSHGHDAAQAQTLQRAVEDAIGRQAPGFAEERGREQERRARK
ncbi:hypothetical protein WOLCODRAFT_157880, partial [Wolfiporia cocos MD-104 SS10]